MAKAIDTVFPYQFVIYFAIFGWTVYSMFTESVWWWIFEKMDHQEEILITISLLCGPISVFVGYFFREKIFGIWLTLAGDLGLWFSLSAYITAVWADLNGKPIDLSMVITSSLSGAIFLRVLRDLILIFAIRNPPKIPKERMERARRAIQDKKVEKDLEVRGTQEVLELREVEGLLKETRSILKRRG